MKDQGEVFDYLRENGESTIQQIADSLNRSRRSVRNTLYRLEERELIQRLENGNWEKQTFIVRGE